MEKLNYKNIGNILLLFFLFSGLSFAQSPSETIKKANNKIAEIQKNNNNQKQIESLIGKVLDESSSFVSMANSVKSSICNSIPENKCKEFSTAFSEMLRLSYMNKLSKYNSSDIKYIGETINNNKALVKTQIKIKDKTYKIDYELEKINNKWAIINYIFDDINTVDNYKKQFKRMIKKDSIDSIIQNIKKKIDDFKKNKVN